MESTLTRLRSTSSRAAASAITASMSVRKTPVDAHMHLPDRVNIRMTARAEIR
jgi:hypothetical protein